MQQVGQVRPGIQAEPLAFAAAAGRAAAQHQRALPGRQGGQAPADRLSLPLGQPGYPAQLHAGQVMPAQAGLEQRRRLRVILARVAAATGGPGRGAGSRPSAHQVQVRGQAPRFDRLEHVVLQHEVPGIGPVVRDLPGIVISHDIRRARRAAHGHYVPAQGAAAGHVQFRGPHEAVHLPAVGILDRVLPAMLATAVHQARVVIRPVALTPARIWHAHREMAVLSRDAVRSGIRAEERVERPVLLHDHYHVPDLVDAGQHRRRRSLRAHRPGPRACGAAAEHQGAGRRDHAPARGRQPTVPGQDPLSSHQRREHS